MTFIFGLDHHCRSGQKRHFSYLPDPL